LGEESNFSTRVIREEGLRGLPTVDTLVISETARVETAGTLVKSSSVKYITIIDVPGRPRI
jgi:hypothetical protein